MWLELLIQSRDSFLHIFEAGVWYILAVVAGEARASRLAGHTSFAAARRLCLAVPDALVERARAAVGRKLRRIFGTLHVFR